jgi:hypothetical protein
VITVSSISSMEEGLRIGATLLVRLPTEMIEPTHDDVDALVGPATPHFAFQIRARVRELIDPLAEDHPVRVYGEERIVQLDQLGFASTKAENDEEREPRTRAGWDEIPSSAPASDPLPR